MTNLNDLLEKLSTYTRQPIYDPRIIWLLIGVDYSYIEAAGIQAILDYESREPGCIGAMGKAFIKLLNDVASNDLFNIGGATTPEQQEICAKKIEERMLHFHSLCVDKVSGLNKDTNPSEYRHASMTYGFHPNTNHPNGTAMGYTYLNSRRGIRGLNINGQTQFIENFYAMANNLDGSFKIICFAKPDDIKNLAKILIMRLIQDLQCNITDNEVLLSISEFIQDMTLLHPFTDANNRVLVNLLLNEILIDIGFSPVIFREPNIFDGFNPYELAIEIQKGQQLLEHVVCYFGELFSEGLEKNCKALLGLALRSDSHKLISMALSSTGVPGFFEKKFTSLVLDFKRENTSTKDLLQDKDFLRYFLHSYGDDPGVVFASMGLLLSLLDDNASGHLSWQLDFFIKYFFDNNMDEHVIIDGYFNALTLTHKKTLLDMLFSESGNGNTLYRLSKNRTSIIFRCINWYTRINGLGKETEENISGLTELLDKQSPINEKLSCEERKKIDTRIENVFRHRRNRTLSA